MQIGGQTPLRRKRRCGVPSTARPGVSVYGIPKHRTWHLRFQGTADGLRCTAIGLLSRCTSPFREHFSAAKAAASSGDGNCVGFCAARVYFPTRVAVS